MAAPKGSAAAPQPLSARWSRRELPCVAGWTIRQCQWIRGG